MKYKLIENKMQQENFSNNHNNLIDRILLNRGIQNPQHFLNLSDDDLYSYKLLSNIDEAVKCLLSHIENKNKILILSDPDADGLCSSSMLYQYLKEISPDINLDYLLQSGKEHGLNNKLNIPENTKLLLIPDAGSNDFEKCKELSDKGIQIIILDHHEFNKKNDYAIIVNPMLDDYLNKQLSGGAVVYKFLQALDENLWENKADKYLDLVALSLIGDSMDTRVAENKRLIDLGLSNVKNKAFQAIINKQNYSMNGLVTIQNVQFYVVPLLNATIRSGEMEDKKNLFEAFCQIDKEFDYKKRGETEVGKEDIYTMVARVATNLRAKQNREIDKGLEIINKDIEKYNRNDNKFLFANASELDSNFIGLTAMKLASQYSKPCILIHPSTKSPNYFTGSMRNFNGSPIENLKDFISDTKLFDFVQGHQFAAGLGIKKENIKKAIDKINELLKDVDFDKIYKVDFIFDAEEITLDFVVGVDELKNMWGNNIDEPLLLVKNVRINTNDIELIGKENDTFKFRLNDDGVTCMKFKCNQDDPILKLKEEEPLGTWIELEAVVKVNMNSFNQILSPQAVIQDYNLIKKG
jgi:single-stranded-DNA-specific exonuclease